MEITEIHSLFWQKFRESSDFTKEVVNEFIQVDDEDLGRRPRSEEENCLKKTGV